MWIKIVLACFAVFVCLCLPAQAAVHPNQKKIGKWNAKIAKLQGKIDHENSLRSTMVVGMISTFVPSTTIAPTAVYVTPAPPEVQYVPPPPVTVQVPMPRVIIQHRIRTRTYIVP